MTREESRAQFEAWLKDLFDLEGTWQPERNCYKEFPCHMAWKAWQSRTEAYAEDAPADAPLGLDKPEGLSIEETRILAAMYLVKPDPASRNPQAAYGRELIERLWSEYLRMREEERLKLRQEPKAPCAQATAPQQDDERAPVHRILLRHRLRQIENPDDSHD